MPHFPYFGCVYLQKWPFKTRLYAINYKKTDGNIDNQMLQFTFENPNVSKISGETKIEIMCLGL